MTEAITKVTGLGKHYLGLALVAIFIVAIVAFTWNYIIPKLNEKSKGKTTPYLGNGGAPAPAAAPPAAAGFTLA